MPKCYMVKKIKKAPIYGESVKKGQHVYKDYMDPLVETTNDSCQLGKDTNYLHGYFSSSPCQAEITSCSSVEEVCSLDGGIPIVRVRTLEETEAARDLLELSRRLPPLPSSYPQYGSEEYDITQNSQSFHQTTIPVVSPDHQLEETVCPVVLPPSDCQLYTPPTPDSSSDAENTNPSPNTKEDTSSDSIISDGRSKPRRSSVSARYTCSECGKNYATSSNLSRHKQTHRSLDSQSAKRCPTCGKAYVSMPALAMHILTHNLSHKCEVCGKAFSRPWLLQGHLRSHTGERPFGCVHCGKAFADRSNLRAHMQTHSSLKAFRCSRCNKAFALKAYLNKHYESVCIKDNCESSDSN